MIPRRHLDAAESGVVQPQRVLHKLLKDERPTQDVQAIPSVLLGDAHRPQPVLLRLLPQFALLALRQVRRVGIEFVRQRRISLSLNSCMV